MSYYCKKCGAVVVGKFCSCCGQKVKTAFEEFISAKNRQRRAFRRWAEQKDFNRYAEPNRVHKGKMIYGPFLVVGAARTRYKNLNAEQMERYKDMFRLDGDGE